MDGKTKAMSQYYLTSGDRARLEQKLKDLDAQLIRLGNSEGKDAIQSMASDVRHTNARNAFLEEQYYIQKEILRIKKILREAEQISVNNEYRRVNIGDTVLVRCHFGEEVEEMKVQLASYVDSIREREVGDVLIVTVSSEFGQAIYKKLIGDVVSYGQNNVVEILEKVKNPEVVQVGDLVDIIYQEEGFYEEPRCIYLVDDKLLPEVSKELAYLESLNLEVDCVSVDSPMGKAIYGCNVCDKCAYINHDRQHKIRINGKMSLPSNVKEQKTRGLKVSKSDSNL